MTDADPVPYDGDRGMTDADPVPYDGDIGVIDACDRCLRRAYLVARLAPRIAALLERPRDRPGGLLALDEDRLITAVAGPAAPAVRAWLAAFDPRAARAALGRNSALCLHAAAYPAALRHLSDPPPVLFACGRVGVLGSLEEEPAVTLVGARRASPYALEVAHSLGRGLAAAGLTVVSGLALGVDAAAHRGSLDARGRVVAVLAGGSDIPYPRRNRALYERIRGRGAVVSELPPGTRALRWSFPARNRIMAGLAAMTVVVEAAERSGSLITGEFARDSGRLVGAVPGRVTSRLAAGSNRLLRDGAAVITGAQDVLDELYGVGARSAPAPARRPPPRDPVLAAVLSAVEECRDSAEIAERAGIGAAEARAALGRLESDGYVARDRFGEYRARAP